MSPINDQADHATGARPNRLNGGDIATVVVIYAAAGALWILLSDAILLFTDDAASAAVVSIFKGLGFVAVTSLLLYLVLRRFRSSHAMVHTSPDNRFEHNVYAIMIIAVLIIVVAGFVRVRALVQSGHEDLTARVTAVAGRELRDVENWVDAHRREAALLASLATEAAGAPDPGSVAARVLGPLATGTAGRDILLVDDDGRIAWSASGLPGADVNRDALARAHARRAVVVEPTPAHVDFLAPARPHGTVVLRMHIDVAQDLAGDAVAAFGDGARVYLFAPGSGRMIGLDRGATDEADGRRDDALLQAAAAVPGRPVDGADAAGRGILAVVLPVAGTDGWHLAMVVQQNQLASPLGRDLSWIVGGVAVALILPLAAGLLLTQRRRLNRMELIDRQRDERVALVQHYDALVQKARDMILLIDDDDRIVDANEAAREGYGYTLEELQRMPIEELVAPDERTNVSMRLDLAGSPGGTLFESSHRRRDGQIIPVEVSARSVTIEGRRFRQALVRDISLRHHDQARIERLTRLHRALSNCNQVIIRSRSRDTLFAEVCRALVETGGLAMAWMGVVERRGERVIPVAVHGVDGASYTGRLNISLDGSDPRGRGPTATCMREDRAVWSEPGTLEETVPWTAWVALPVHERGRVSASLNAYTRHADGFDEDERRILETLAGDLSNALDYLATLRTLRESEERWGFALEGSLEGVWDRHIETDEVFYSSHWKHMLGYGDGDVGTGRFEWRKRVHPDDLPGVEAVIDAHLRGETGHYACEYRMQSRDGEYVWILDRGKVIARDDAGRPLRMIGTHSDVTDRKIIEEKLSEQAQILEESQAIAHVGSWQHDVSTGAFTASGEALRIHGTTTERFDGSREAFTALLHDHDRDAFTRWLETLRAGRQPGEIEYRTVDGARQVNARGIADTEGESVVRIAGTVQDVTEWRATELRLQEQLDELQRWYEITLDREERIMDLKDEVNQLLAHRGEPPRYQAREKAS